MGEIAMLRKYNFRFFILLNAALFLPCLLAHAEISGGTPAGAATGAATAQPTLTGEEDPNNITLDFKDADIKTVLRVMSLKSRVNIVAGPEVRGTITIRLEDVPWEKALEVVLRTYGYVYERDENIIRVTTRDNLAMEPLTTQTYVLNYTKAKEIQTAVQDMLTERGRIQIAERTNTIIISDIPTNLYRVGEVIKKLDKITPQAFIDSKIVKTDVGITENLGIEWKTGGSNNLGSLTASSRPTTFPFMTRTDDEQDPLAQALEQFLPIATSGSNAVPNPFADRAFPLNPSQSTTGKGFEFGTLDFTDFSSVLQMLQSRSNTKVVSNPRIVVLNNQTATVQVGSDVPLPNFERNETTGSVEVTGFSFRQVGVVLNVTPHINTEEEILVDLQPEVSSTGATIDFKDFQVPSFNVTKAVTQVLIRSGQTIAIGGLLTDSVSTSESKVPYLGDIPLVGKLFRSKRQSAGDSNKKIETLFFVTVTMVDTEGQPTGERAAQRKRKNQTQGNANKPKEKVATQASELKSAESQESNAASSTNPAVSETGMKSQAAA
ncbi:MAG: secretin and TonB N-terminal domain-containing protein [Candidatus Omnitrophica bacterium]|nr:secretin and TonB N-terminal domain-containing protein [Candidatus Omnitrophota bacterium]